MSHVHFDLEWQRSMEELAELVDVENPPPELDEDGQPAKVVEVTIQKQEAFQHYAALYIRYLQAVRSLEACYDQIVHPQKRRDIKSALEVSISRLCQVKAKLVLFNPVTQSNYVNLDEYLVDLKMSPSNLEVPVPFYFREENQRSDDKVEVLERSFELHGGLPLPQPRPIEAKIPEMSLADAIRTIQKNERGRQGRMRATLMKELREDDAARQRASQGLIKETDPQTAAVTIQRVFRGFVDRKRAKQMNRDELVFLGMLPPSAASGLGDDSLSAAMMRLSMVTGQETIVDSTMGLGNQNKSDSKASPQQHAAKVVSLRRDRRKDNEMDYKRALEDLQQVVLDTEGPEYREDMRNERYNWWIAEKERTGKYPDDFTEFYVQKEKREHPERFAVASESLEEKNSKKSSKKDKKGGKKGGKKDKGKSKKTEAADKGGEGKITNAQLIGPTELVTTMKTGVQKYATVWSSLDESDNFQQKHDVELAKDKVRPIVIEKIRLDVDQKLLQVLENLKLQVAQKAAGAKGKKKKGAKGGKKKGGKKKGGKGKAGAKKGKKSKLSEGEKLCQGLTLEDMVAELVKFNIVQDLRKAPEVEIADFTGQFNFLGSAYQRADVQQDPSLAQIRQCVTEYGVLPLGSDRIASDTPFVATMLLYGPRGSGKTLLSRAIAKSTSATWFDLSPSNIEDKFSSQKQIAKVVHMVFEVAKEYQPSCIYIDEVDKVFAASKSKKGSGEGAARIKKDLISYKSRIDKQTRILVIGNSSRIFADNVDRSDVKKFFGQDGKMLFTPYPDYMSRVQLWQHFLEKQGLDVCQVQEGGKFDLSTLAYVTEGYSAGSIEQAVKNVCTQRRIQKFHEVGRAFDTTEFIGGVSKTLYTYKDDFDAFREFTDDVTGEKARRKLREESTRRTQDDAAATQGKGKQKGKKSKT